MPLEHTYDKSQQNTGHGHVRPRPDGVKARCGGPGRCTLCSREQAAAAATADPRPAAAEDVADRDRLAAGLVELVTAADRYLLGDAGEPLTGDALRASRHAFVEATARGWDVVRSLSRPIPVDVDGLEAAPVEPAEVQA